MSKTKHKNSEKGDLGKFQNFLRAFGATRLLLQRAYERGSLIEGLVLYAALVDGFCRICLVLKEQFEKKNGDINQKYIYQHDDEPNFNERKIFGLVFEKKIIDKNLFKELNTLYDIRNKVIHRFFISEVEYSHLEIVCTRYEKVYEQLRKITYDLESEQIKQGVGMTISGKYTEEDKIETRRDVFKKIKSGSERNLAKTLGCTSVEEIIEFGSKRGFFKKCKECKHLKIEHFDHNALQRTKTKVHNLDTYLSICKSKDCSCKIYRSFSWTKRKSNKKK